MNKEVNFEIAKLLQEKGYNQWSAKWYSVEGFCYKENEFDNCIGYIPTKDCNAPTIAEVVMWLYEKYGVWVSCDATVNLWFYSISTPETGKMLVSTSDNHFNSPTEAYEAAIKYVLKKKLNMTNIPTAEEFMLDTLESMDQQEVERAMIGFAKMHVEAALKAAAEKAEITNKAKFPADYNPVVDEDSILNAYPLNNIK